MNFTADGRDRLKASLLQILKILVSCRLSQLDANPAKLQFFCTLLLSRAVAIVALALIRNNIRLTLKLMLYCILFCKIFDNIKMILISFNCHRHITQKSETWLKKKQALLHCLHIYIIL